MEGNNLSSFENLCKIFETRIKLDKEKNIETPPDVVINYEKYSKKIDSIYNAEFEKKIKPLIVPAVTIEKEEERLEKLISLLKNRLDSREELENRYYLTTGTYIKGLQLIVSPNELEDKKNRLEIISKYLDTRNEINTITNGVSELKEKLKEETIRQEEYIKKNKIMEEELYSTFKDIISEEDYLSKINEEDIDTSLALVTSKVEENKETLEVTKDSVNSLIINGDNDDYATYIEDAERMYFTWKNRELLLKIYSLVINMEDNYNELYEKRDKISKIVRNRRSIKENLTIEITDNFSSFEEVLQREIEVLKNEKEVLENVSNYTNRINFKEERLSELEEANNAVEILSILREYGLIDTYDNEKEELEEVYEEDILPIEDNTYDDKEEKEEEIKVREINPYLIVEVVDYPKTLNIGLAKLKGESVREKVNKKLNPVAKAPTFLDIKTKIDEKQESKDNTSEENITEETPSINKEEKPINIPSWELPSYEELKPKEVIEEPSPSKEIKLEEEKLPTWDIPSKVEDNNIDIWNSPSIEKEEASVKKETLVWDTKPLPDKEVWNLPEIEPKKEEVQTDNSFWVPVSDSKLETNAFPSINIPISNNVNQNDNFGFPDLNN